MCTIRPMAVAPRQPRYDIASLRPIDLDALMEIERLSFRTPWARQVFLEEMEREWAHVDVIRPRAGGAALGFANFWLVRDEVHLLNLAAHPDHRRRGLGAQLIDHVIQFARRHRCRYVTLEVRRTNVAAVGLYRKFGFQAVGVRPHYYAEDGEDAIVMVLEIQA